MILKTNLPIGELAVDLASRTVTHIVHEDKLLANCIIFESVLTSKDKIHRVWTFATTIPESLFGQIDSIENIFIQGKIFPVNGGHQL